MPFCLATLMLLTSTGFLIDIHYCQNQFKRISFIGKAKTCQEVAAQHQSCSTSTNSCTAKNHEDKGCCQNRSSFVKYDGDLVHNTQIQSENTRLKLYKTPLLIKNWSFIRQNVKASILQYYWPPPFIKKNAQVVFQQFLC